MLIHLVQLLSYTWANKLASELAGRPASKLASKVDSKLVSLFREEHDHSYYQIVVDLW